VKVAIFDLQKGEVLAMSLETYGVDSARSCRVENPGPKRDLTDLLSREIAAQRFRVPCVYEKTPDDAETRAGFGKETLEEVIP
jgi:hypothetical protein